MNGHAIRLQTKHISYYAPFHALLVFALEIELPLKSHAAYCAVELNFLGSNM